MAIFYLPPTQIACLLSVQFPAVVLLLLVVTAALLPPPAWPHPQHPMTSIADGPSRLGASVIAGNVSSLA